MASRFTSPSDPNDFNTRVWILVRQIPAGKVATYGQVAALITPPAGLNLKSYLAFGARWVGGAMANCPQGVPWWRVINAKGEVSLRGGAQEQRDRLQVEGVTFDERGRVDLKHFRWEGPLK